MPIDNNLVIQLIEQIEVELAERANLLALLRKQLGAPATIVAPPVNRKSEEISSNTGVSHEEPKQAEKPAFRLNGNADPNFIPIATHAIDVLREAGKPLALRDIVSAFKELQSVDTNKKNFSTSLYTAMMRRTKELYKTEKGEWALTEWKQSQTPFSMYYGSGDVA